MSRPIAALKRVLMTADTVGGVWTCALELARVLSRRGVRVSLAVLGPAPSGQQQSEVREVSGLELYHAPYQLEWMDEPWVDLARAGEWLLRLEARVKPEIVHVNGYVHAALPWRAPVVAVGHSCVLSWWEAVHREPAPPVWDRYRREVGTGLRSARRVVAPTAAMLTQLERHYGPLPPTLVIPNGRDARLFPPRETREPFILTAGRLWDEARNVEVLERIAPAVRWPIYAAGAQGTGERESAGSSRPTLMRVDEGQEWFVATSLEVDQSPSAGTEMVAPDGTPGKLHYFGQLTDAQLAHWLGRASIFVLPARYEPFGLTALEAALAGCVLVLGDIPSLREVWGDAALYVPPGDSELLCEALNALIDDPVRRIALGVRAMVRAMHFTPERMADRYLELYQDMLAAPEVEFRPAVAASRPPVRSRARARRRGGAACGQ